MHLFNRLPIIVDDPSLPVVPSTDIQTLVDFEPAAYAALGL
nr:hypothetical protein [uncultured Shimia sp.]